MGSDKANIDGTLQNIALAVVWLGLFGLPTACKAANNCPWINEATASGLLGGEAVGAVTGLDSGGTAICQFTQKGDGFERTLSVTVERAQNAHVRLSTIAQGCGSRAVPLKAVGNEALVCVADDRKTGQKERVVGRVRDQVFTITITTTLKADPILTREELTARINVASEQVSGYLF